MIGICEMHCKGLFTEECKVWIPQGNNPTNSMDFVAFHTFWETAINIASFTATPASHHGYGMNTIEDNTSADSLTNTVSNFGAACVCVIETLARDGCLQY
jgi:hypothetical protein